MSKLHPTPCALHPTSGFTLVEMIVSIALFSFVMLTVTAVLMNIIAANHKAQGQKVTIDNLSLVIENMARNLRTGYNYNPDPASSPCNTNGVTGIDFTDQNGNGASYTLSGTGIRKSGVLMTAPEIAIDNLCFYIVGTGSGHQPNVLITVGGYTSPNTAAGAKGKNSATYSRFDIETFVSQRQLNVH